jgi:hypothetical protein
MYAALLTRGSVEERAAADFAPTDCTQGACHRPETLLEPGLVMELDGLLLVDTGDGHDPAEVADYPTGLGLTGINLLISGHCPEREN